MSELQSDYLTGTTDVSSQSDENITYTYDSTDGSYTATIDAVQTDGDTWASETSDSTSANIGGKNFAPGTDDGAWVIEIDKDGDLSVTTGSANTSTATGSGTGA